MHHAMSSFNARACFARKCWRVHRMSVECGVHSLISLIAWSLKASVPTKTLTLVNRALCVDVNMKSSKEIQRKARHRLKPIITIVGSVNMDLVIRVPRFPAPGETISGRDFQTIPGGKGANQAVAAARMGAEVHFIGSVGNDNFGERLERGLAHEGIELAHLSHWSEGATGIAMIYVSDAGQNMIVISPGANGQLTLKHIDWAKDVIGASQILLCQLETPLAIVSHAINIAHAAGVPVILNPAPATPLPRELIARVAYLIPNETEASLLTGIEVTDGVSAQRACVALREQGAANVVITLGEQGVVSLSENDEFQSQSATRVSVVDTTGAGDTFVGSFAVEIAQGRSLHDAIAFAQSAAALKITKLGAQASIPTRDAVAAFIRESRTV